MTEKTTNDSQINGTKAGATKKDMLVFLVQVVIYLSPLKYMGP